MIARANSLPSIRNSRNAVPLAATRMVETGRSSNRPVNCRPRPPAPSWKIGTRPREYDTCAPSFCQVGVVTLAVQMNPEKSSGGR